MKSRGSNPSSKDERNKPSRGRSNEGSKRGFAAMDPEERREMGRRVWEDSHGGRTSQPSYEIEASSPRSRSSSQRGSAARDFDERRDVRSSEGRGRGRTSYPDDDDYLRYGGRKGFANMSDEERRYAARYGGRRGWGDRSAYSYIEEDEDDEDLQQERGYGQRGFSSRPMNRQDWEMYQRNRPSFYAGYDQRYRSESLPQRGYSSRLAQDDREQAWRNADWGRGGQQHRDEYDDEIYDQNYTVGGQAGRFRRSNLDIEDEAYRQERDLNRRRFDRSKGPDAFQRSGESIRGSRYNYSDADDEDYDEDSFRRGGFRR